MYLTRVLSHYKKYPDSLSILPEGPNSGYLVILDEEAERYCCLGLCKDRRIKNLPFPQNKNLTVRYEWVYYTDNGQESVESTDDVVFIPVLNQPLSSNRYYAIKPHGKHKGEAYTCSRDEDMGTCCFCRCIRDIKSRPLNPQDIYQQYEISSQEKGCSGEKGKFRAKSVVPHGHPPRFLRRKGWTIDYKTPKKYNLGEASGLNTALRARLPEFTFPLSYQSSEVIIVGKWYCPFVFIKDGQLKKQMKRSMFYEMTLEQKWEKIFARENKGREKNVVSVDVGVKKEVVFVGEKEAVWDKTKVVDGTMCFTSSSNVKVGLSLEIVERMKWEQERGGWVGGEEREARVKRKENFRGIGGWRKFGCYALIERFVLKRMDGSLVLTYEFNHIHQIKSKWE